MDVLTDLDLRGNQIKNGYLQGTAKRVHSEFIVKVTKGSTLTEKRYSGEVEISLELSAKELGLPHIFELDTGEELEVDPISNKLVIPTIRGLQGFQGIQGLQGFQGIKGLQGTQGTQGLQGLQGTQGSKGLQGDMGFQGFQGLQGIQGIQGLQGTQGTQGTQGSTGLQGKTGQGVQGIQGETGIQGIQGAANGPQGVQGLQGIDGLQGKIGSKGNQGVQGLQGTLGSQGTTGIEGKSVKVLDNGNYAYWDQASQSWVDTNIKAQSTLDPNSLNINFTESSVEDNISTGESIPTVFGKIKKWFSRLKGLAFKDKVDYSQDILNIPNDLARTNDIVNHNVNLTAHSDIRSLISSLDSTVVKIAKLSGTNGIKVTHMNTGDVILECTLDTTLFVTLPSGDLPNPSGMATNKIYLKPEVIGDNNIVREYIIYNGQWEKVGELNVDLSGYPRTSELPGHVNPLINSLITSHNQDANAHANFFGGSSKSIPISSWVANGSKFKAEIEVTGVKSNSNVWVVPQVDYEDAWIEFGLYSAGDTATNKITLHARKKPNKIININIVFK